MYDAALQHLELARRRSRAIAELGLEPGRYALVTVHRAENTDEVGRLKSLMGAFGALAESEPVVWPVHPRTRAVLDGMRLSVPSGVRTVPPVSYFDMLMLCSNARLVLTDSGGVQREAFFFRVPCLTLRGETEWPETVELGWNRVVGVETERIIDAARSTRPGKDGGTPFGSGDAAERIVAILASL
jgi:UDP-GlcNAc3NAcA epimerase